MAEALVVLPFATAAQAEQFAQIVTVQLSGDNAAPPFVLLGNAYEYVNNENGERGQVIEVFPDSKFEVFVGQQGSMHHVLQRVTQEAADGSAEGSPDHDVPDASAGEGG